LDQKSLNQKCNCRLRIKGIYTSLKSAERRLSDFVMNNPEETIHLTIEKLAEKSDSSYATISRFCKKLGFNGFKDFKSRLIHDVLQNRHSDYSPDQFSIAPGTDTSEICDLIFDFSTKVLEESIAMVDTSIVDQVVSVFIHANKIIFVGVGTSGISARYAFSKFFRLGFNCDIELDIVINTMKCSLLSEKDVLFAISSSGRSRKVVESAKIAKEKGAIVISLSDFAISPLSKVADINLYTTPRNANLYKDIEVPLFIGQIAIIDLLFSCCSIRKENFAEIHYITKLAADKEKI